MKARKVVLVEARTNRHKITIIPVVNEYPKVIIDGTRVYALAANKLRIGNDWHRQYAECSYWVNN